ncbi:Ktr system potassium uptake protein B [Pseudooceanicola marinus]|uniref:Ktr system potassium uptake protein B n=1 Tax=Pseudooceanicola marinus TaxID=396013 RepID=A0A1X6ZGZ4_9RHOB|nr:TrkH family potassium uptake protein [Pseudooceanicola marinus]PJE28528.1 Ktr system potassium transporter B [Pseudooceanicola marinus]SLN50827.1 Ktr system potassium uptake protein B [Pseudooceanicola marinus]
MQLPPPALLAGLYAVLIVLGGALLMLPAATALPITWSDAIFTAASAVTVTGLVISDTGSQFTLIGQGIIMLLIQLGGLGLMTFAVLLLSMLGLPVTISQRIFLREDLNQTSISDLLVLVRGILKTVLACELLGVTLLSGVFVPEFGWAEGLWQALFHTVSAFNNAGFALFPDSLSRYVGNPIVNLTIPALFIFGGLGFIVVTEAYGKRSWRAFSLHTKLMVVGTLALIVWSVLTFAVLEWTNPATLGGLASTGDRLWASWFQGVTTRTAGFNTVDIGGIHDSTSMMFMSLMVIGGGSTSTAGGIKVTTFIVLLLATVAFFRRSQQLHVFGRSIGAEEVMKVLALTMVSLMTVLVAIFLVTLSHDGNFIDLAFEVTSAFGTVGLSRGTTGELDGFGRAVIIAVMFVGRVGPLTLGFFLATRSKPRVGYPASKVYLG